MMVKYWPGAASFPSDLPQTNFAAYWKILVWAELCAAVRPYEEDNDEQRKQQF